MKIKYWIPPILWAILIFYLSSLSIVPGPKISLDPFGYLRHSGLYGIWGILISFALFKSNLESKKKIILMTVLIGFLYGLSDEFHQSFVPGRSVDFFDALADTVGSFLGGLIYLLINKIRKQ